MSTSIRGLGRLFLFLAFGAAGARLWAQQPALTTIRDTVYKADGQPYNGLVLIEWKSFQVNDSNIGHQGSTVRVVNGNLFVKLAPTTSVTNAYYQVRYNSDGQFQFSEVWSVPPSATALKLKDVRAMLLPGGIVTGGGVGGVIVGGDTAGGSSVPGFGDAQVPAGAINGINTIFVLPAAPSPANSLALFKNGLLQTLNNDYTLNGVTISFNPWAIPQFGDILDAYYRTAPAVSPSASHSLLSSLHGDTTPSNPARGGLIVGQGSGTPTWAQLPLGPAGRCLTSNGTDAVWSPCLYTAFTPGSVPFVDSNGSLSQNSTTLAYNSLSRKLSVGNNTPRATLNVHDAGSSGITELTVRAGVGQGSVPMQTWISNAGQSLAFVNADGGFNVRRLLTNSSNVRPGFSDAGTPTDPAVNVLSDGDAWYNTAARVRRTFEGAQIHSTPQIICSSIGASTSNLAFTELGTCTLPAASLFSGDRLEIEATFQHTGGTIAGEIDVLAGATTLAGRAVPAGDDVYSLTVNIGLGTDRAGWRAQTFGVASGLSNNVGQIPFTSGGAFGPLKLRARQVAAGTDAIRLINFTVRRIPQQTNP